MTLNAPFSSPAEQWAEISEFPLYCVSNKGQVMRAETGRLITPTRNSNGVVIVGLMRNRVQAKRSLALLVATAFVSRSTKPAFNTPINLNGDRADNHATNLMWRPLWFARQYVRQFDDGHSTYNSPIEDVETHEVYENSMTAAIYNGVLDHEIVLSMMNNSYVWPTCQIFRKVNSRQIP